MSFVVCAIWIPSVRSVLNMTHSRMLSVILLLSAMSSCGVEEDQTEKEMERANLVLPRGLIRAARPVAGQYIVVFRQRMPRASAEYAAQKGLTLRHVYQATLNGIAVRMSEDKARGLLEDPLVERVVEDEIASVDGMQYTTLWGLDRIDQRSPKVNGMYGWNRTGAGVHAYIVDTGMNTAHQEFAGRVREGFSIFGTDVGDCNGHGTHVAGIVGGRSAGVAKDVLLHPVRVGACSDELFVSDIIAGLDWVLMNHVRPAVVNLSLGGPANDTLDSAVSALVNAGLTVTVAAGNNNSDACAFSPARVGAAITVGAITGGSSSYGYDLRTSFSNQGACVDLFAPGSQIGAAGMESNSDIDFKSGTSQAAPFVAGTAAMYLQQHPTASGWEVANAIIGNATTGSVLNATPNRCLYSRFF
ncbi:S8 family peptidase [Cystobacter fuscus]|uniref:S8 family peptidase n=1 Tax=Cystobacter fuscus TaxID=43 RepID=UPI0009DFDC1A|nr:S8 family peptidase [Cystobacter fuscus]